MEYNNSPFSRKFKKYKGMSEEDITTAIITLKEQVKSTKKNNPEKQSTKIEYWLAKGFTEEEARKELSKRQSTFSLEKCIERYGIEVGTKKWQERQDKWQAKIKNKTAEETTIINKKKINSLESFILKYGEETGTKKFTEMNEKRAYKSSRKSYIDKHGEETGNLLYNERRKNCNTGRVSKISQKLFNDILAYIPLLRHDDIYFAEHQHEYYKYCNNEYEKIYSYDFVDKKLMKCIEFNGDHWHANPINYTEDKQISGNWLAKHQWAKDERKNNYIKEKGFELLIIWESDYKQNPNEVLQRCLEFLKSV